MSADPPLVVELLGQPGAGKSTLVRSVAEGSDLLTRADLYAAWKRQPKLSKAALLARTLADAPCLAAAAKFALTDGLFTGDSLSRLVRLLIKSHWLRSRSGPFILEEGYLQDLWSILYSARRSTPEPRHLAPLMRCLYRGLDVQIVFLEVDPQSAFDRIRARAHGKSRLDRLPQQELRNELFKYAELPSRLADSAQLAGLRVEHIDASLPADTSAGFLREILQRLDTSAAERRR